MSDGQLDLFAGPGVSPAQQPASPPAPRPPVPSLSDLDDAALLAAIPASSLPDGPALAREARRRRIQAAIPVLEGYCRRFAGFGLAHPLPEQRAALDALAAIGGPDAAASVAHIITRGSVQGPTLAHAVAAAAAAPRRNPRSAPTHAGSRAAGRTLSPHLSTCSAISTPTWRSRLPARSPASDVWKAALH